jgi:hypothetical protein
VNRQTSAYRFAGRATRPFLACALAAMALAGCSDVRRVIGFDRTAPDEFAVVTHSPLTLPPNMRAQLPEPRPGVPRPQEPSATEVAKASVFGKGTPAKGAKPAASGGASVLAARVGGSIDPDIRKKVDQESTELAVADRRWIDSLLFWQEPDKPGVVIDPKKEQERLRQAQAEGKPAAAGVAQNGVVPVIERKRKAPLEGLF